MLPYQGAWVIIFRHFNFLITLPWLPECTIPSGCSMYTSSCSEAIRIVGITSILCISLPFDDLDAAIYLMLSNVVIGLIVWPWSSLSASHCLFWYRMRLMFYHFPLLFAFTLKTHFNSITILPSSNFKFCGPSSDSFIDFGFGLKIAYFAHWQKKCVFFFFWFFVVCWPILKISICLNELCIWEDIYNGILKTLHTSPCVATKV